MSKLGGHFMNGGNPKTWIDAGARIFKFAPEVLGESALVPPGPLVVGKLDQQDEALGITDWKAFLKQGLTPEAAAGLRFTAQTSIYVGANKPRVNRYEVNPRIDVWEDDNEVAPDNADEAAWFAEYCIGMMRRYESIGKKRANFSFAVGTPAMDIWPHLLPAVKHARDHGHYIALHEYMGYEPDFGVGWRQIDADRQPTTHVWHGRPDRSYPWGWAALRYRYVWDTVLAPAGLGDVRLLITELGCDNVASVTPAGMPAGTWKDMDLSEAAYSEMLCWYDRMIRQDAYVHGAVVFTVGSVGNWVNWDIAGTGVEARLLDYIKTTADEDDMVSPPVIAPPDATPPDGTGRVDYLTNGDFEGGWYHPVENGVPVPELQLPNNWALKWRDGREAGWSNPFDPAEHARFVRPEIRTLPVEQLPPHEQPLFVRDGHYTLKAFKGNGSLYFSLMQTVKLPAGKWRLSAPVFPDLVQRYDNGRKVWATDPNAGLWRLRVGPFVVSGQAGDGPFGGGWRGLRPGEWNELTAEFETAGAPADVKIDFLLPFALPQNGIFADGWQLTAVEPGEPEPEPLDPPTGGSHKAIVLKLPQDVTANEWGRAADYAYGFRHTMTASHDDMLTLLRGGNGESFVKLAYPARQVDAGQLATATGYRWEPLFDEPPAAPFAFAIYPVEGERVVTQAFGARPEVYAQYGFPGHEGIDLRATSGSPVHAVAGGVVRKITTSGNYGNRIDIRHDGGWTTTYAHLNKFAGLSVGTTVAAGTVIGYAGSTGNSTGVHLHLGLKREGHTYTDPACTVWPLNVFDPTPYLKPFFNAPATTTIDVLPYLKGDGRAYMVRHPQDGSHEKFRTVDRADRWLILKNSQWEELWLSGDTIWRGKDTSAGDGQYYRQFEEGKEGARWCPRRMAIGQTWTAPAGHTVQTYRKDGCTPMAHHRNGTAVNRVKLVAKYASRTWNGITVEDVIELETHTGERMWFARGYGLVAWSSDWGVSAIAQLLPVNEADNQPERGCFG